MNTTEQQLALLKSMRESFHEQGVHCAQRSAQLDAEIAKLKQPEPKIAPGRNNHNVTMDELGEGYELADKYDPKVPLELFHKTTRTWRERSIPEMDLFQCDTYRRPIPSPPSPPALWDCADDVPYPWPVMRRFGETIQYSILAVLPHGIAIQSFTPIPWSELKDWQHSTAKNTFAPCTK